MERTSRSGPSRKRSAPELKPAGSVSVCPNGGASCLQRAVRLSRSHAEEEPTKSTNHTKFRRKIAPENPLNSLLPKTG